MIKYDETLLSSCNDRHMAFPKIRGALLRGSHHKDYSILESVSKLPYVANSLIVRLICMESYP